MPYINLDLGFLRHPKTRRLVGLLGRGAEVLLLRLWLHCGEYHCEEGRLTACAAQEIEAIVEWWGTKGECVDALLAVGFLEKVDGGYLVHDWLDHSGHLAAAKRRGRENAAKRWGRIASSNATSNASSINDANSNASSNATSNASSINDANSNADSNADSNASSIDAAMLRAPPSNARAELVTSTPKEEKEKRAGGKCAFVPPTVEEVRAYCAERKNSVDAQRFVDFYASKGWLVGRTSMRDWKASVRTWEGNGKSDAAPEDFFAGIKAFADNHRGEVK